MNFFYVQFCYVWAGEGGEVGRIFISEFLSLCMVIKTFNDNCILHQTGCVLSYFSRTNEGESCTSCIVPVYHRSTNFLTALLDICLKLT